MKEFFEKGLLDPLELMARQVLAVLPSLLAMSIIFFAGLVVAWTASQALERLLRVVGLDRLFDRLGVTGSLLRGGVKTDPSRLVGQAAYWLVMIFATVAALGALNLQPINDFAKSFLAYVPHLVTAGLILVAGWLLSNFVSQAVLIAIGREPVIQKAMFDRLGIAYTAKGISVDEALRTNLPGIWAIGDATGKSILAHVGMQQGQVAAENIRKAPGEPLRHMDYDVIPAVVYSIPEVVSVGIVPADMTGGRRHHPARQRSPGRSLYSPRPGWTLLPPSPLAARPPSR